jgi:hypothetical protein
MSKLNEIIKPLVERFAHDLAAALHGLSVGALAQAFEAKPAAPAKAAPVAPAAPAAPAPTGRAAMTQAQRKRAYGQPCQWEGCTKNLSPRTRPYCGEHAQADKDAKKAKRARAAKRKAKAAKKAQVTTTPAAETQS